MKFARSSIRHLPKVLGDSNQLLQVCLQLLANSLHVLSEHGGSVLTLSSERRAGSCVLRIVTEAARSADQSVAGALAHSEDGLGLERLSGNSSGTSRTALV